MKKFWKRTEGFTLVELIVVIAILGILAGVGTVGYSGYVKKANMAADQQLVSQVANALQLQYYANPTEATSGYVILSTEKTEADGFAAKAMNAAFGGDWDKLTLKYNGWTNTGLMTVINGYSESELDSIVNSSYLTTSTPTSLMKTVTGMTGLANTVISGRVDDLAEARHNLVLLFGEDSDIVENLDSFNMSDDDEYTTVISNMLVNEMATSVEQTPNLQGMLNLYAAAYAYGEANNDFSAFDAMTARLESDDLDLGILLGEGEAGESTGFNFLASALYDDTGSIKSECYDFVYYMDPNVDENFTGDTEAATAKFLNDMSALGTMMGAVKEISGGFMDKDSLLNANLFTTDGIMEQVNAYYNSVKSVADMSDAEREALEDIPDGAVAVFVVNDGSVAAIPGEAYAAGK